MNTKRITYWVIGIAIVYCIILMGLAYMPSENDRNEFSNHGIDYENRLFAQDRVHTLDIQMNENDWRDMKENALEKEYYDCTLVIDGEMFHHVGVRPKGNSTLIQSIVRDWDKHSLVFSFEEFLPAQRYYGLDELMIYNNACDSSFIKSTLCFELMRQMGVPTPLCSHTAVYLNGEYIGLYIAVERVAESFAVRNFGYDYGQLYKPEQFDVSGILTGKTNSNVQIHLDKLSGENDFVEVTSFLEIPTDTVALKYQGENYGNYVDIWNNAVFKIGRSDKKRLVNALKSIYADENIEEVMNLEMLARYFAINAFVLNTDGYLTEMAHNYYLYEKAGQLLMIPWDYDMSLGTVGGVSEVSDITGFINLGIDTPVLNTTMEERPMLKGLLKDARGKALYYDALEELLVQYIQSGWLECYIEQQVKLIYPYVLSDELSAVSEEKFLRAVNSIYDFCQLRSRSIDAQLKGIIPTVTAHQKEQNECLIDCEGFESPDSGSFFQMMFPKDREVGFEDALRTLNGQIHGAAILQSISFSDIVKKIGAHDGSMTEKLLQKGLISDEEEFRKQLALIVLDFVMDIGIFVIAPIVAVAAVIIVHRQRKRRRPTPQQRRDECAV